MTISNGFYCPECRVKYVEHKCKNNTLPCGHDYEKSVYVWSKRYGGPNSIVIHMVGKRLAFNMRGTEGEIRDWLKSAQGSIRTLIDGFIPTTKKEVKLFADAFETWRSSVDEKRMLYYPRLKEAKAEKPAEGDGQS